MHTDFICDANSLFARSFFAAQRISVDPKEPVRLALNTIISILNPMSGKVGSHFDRTLFAWDGQQNPDKQREPKPAIYHDTMAVFKDVLSLVFGTVNVEHAEAEGDDVVATAATASSRAGNNVYIISGDKDLMQLQSSHCQYYSLNERAVLSTSFIVHKFHGIKRPSHIALELALIGDPVDNIKGVHRVGKVKNKELFRAVTADMNCATAKEVLLKQLNETEKSEFLAALSRTQLKRTLPGIAEPQPLILLPTRDFATLGLPELDSAYQQLFDMYAA